ncbi:GIY-YIG nuclease family protein [Candidatus Roizmanbacteria bacterium]|nr:GIY-YIG nuclease family protein [Candidatus Roizmanbacteria bacterium]
MRKSYFVYIITNYNNTVFYTGMTDDLKERIYQHKIGIVRNSFSKRYRLYKLVWFEEFRDPQETIIIEKKVKDMRREKKLELIRKKNPKLKDLFTLR